MNRESETEQHPGPITLAEAVQAICSNRTDDRAAFLDRVWASTRHPEQVMNLDEVCRGRAQAEMFIQALEAVNRRDKKCAYPESARATGFPPIAVGGSSTGARGRDEHGTICGASYGRLRIRLDGDTRSRLFHPEWMLEYVCGPGPSHGDE